MKLCTSIGCRSDAAVRAHLLALGAATSGQQTKELSLPTMLLGEAKGSHGAVARAAAAEAYGATCTRVAHHHLPSFVASIAALLAMMGVILVRVMRISAVQNA